MKRLMILMVAAVALLGMAVPVFAVGESTVGDLVADAPWMPPGTMIYGAIRIDDAMINTLDGLRDRIVSHLPADVAAQVPNLSQALDSALLPVLNGDFQTTIRPWLGNVASMGAVKDSSVSGGTRGILVIQITDRQKAAAAIEQLAASQGTSVRLQRTDTDQYTLFTPANTGVEGGLLLLDNYMIYSQKVDDLLSGPPQSNLVSATDFNDTVSQLPASSYGGILWMDTPGLMQTAPASTRAALGNPGPTVVGITVADGRTLVLDIVQTAASGSQAPAAAAIDPAFLHNVPANSSFILVGTDLNNLYLSLISMISQAAVQGGTSAADVTAQIRQAEQAVGGLLGLRLREDVLSWMTGNYALFASVDSDTLLQLATNPNAMPQFSTLPVGFGLVVEATDPAAAGELVQAISGVIRSLTQQSTSVTVGEETVNGTTVTTLHSDVPLSAQETIPFDLALAANDNVLVVGTRAEVESILNGAPGLDTTPLYTEVSQYLLEKPSVAVIMDKWGIVVPTVGVLALMGPAVGNIFDNIVNDLNSQSSLPGVRYGKAVPHPQQQGTDQQIQDALGIISSASVSATTNSRGSTVIRITLSLS